MHPIHACIIIGVNGQTLRGNLAASLEMLGVPDDPQHGDRRALIQKLSGSGIRETNHLVIT